jgi:site-specific DNA-methyltransferase (adenine-specific)
MKFDVIISNPPYQLSDGGGGAGKSAAPIYQHFVQQAIKLKPSYLTMIIPSRWFSGGKGLESFRSQMLNDSHMSAIIDYADSKDCFPSGVDIPGGICFFLWDKKHAGPCLVTNISKAGTSESENRILNEFDTFIRQNRAVDIVKKARAKHEEMMSEYVSSRKPFGLESRQGFDKDGDIVLRNSSGLGRINREKVLSGFDILEKWKVIVSKVSFEHAGVPDKDGMMRVLSVVQKLPPNSVCTESYLVAGSFNTEAEADNLICYLQTKFVRFLLMQMLASMNMSKTTYSFVPTQDFSKPWTDKELYEKYGLTEDEITFIESTIKPMDAGGDSNA